MGVKEQPQPYGSVPANNGIAGQAQAPVLPPALRSRIVTVSLAGCFVTRCVLIYLARAAPSCVSPGGLAGWQKTATFLLCPGVCQVIRRDRGPGGR